MSPDFLTRDLTSLMREAAQIRDAAFGDRITFSKKVFIPLTKLCRDVCHYCTFARPPRRGPEARPVAPPARSRRRIAHAPPLRPPARPRRRTEAAIPLA